MLTLYLSAAVSAAFARRARWLLAETGTPFEHVPVIQACRPADPAAAGAPRAGTRLTLRHRSGQGGGTGPHILRTGGHK